MAREMKLSVDAFERQYIRRIGRDKSLKEFGDGDCVLLDRQTRRCTVYQSRPIQCRTWPFWTSTTESPEAWAETCQDCPGAGTGKLYSIEQIEHSKRQKEV